MKTVKDLYLKHSAKGSEWENHKYIKRIDGTYYYPDSYAGGRHLSDEQKSKYGEYDKNDPDFDEKNYNDKNRLGDTDFYGFTRPDGTVVILEEDMKWTLPAGTKITPELIKRLEAFDKTVETMRNNGQKVDANRWNEMAKEAIDGKSSGGSDGKLSDKDVENLANEIIKKGSFGNGNKRKELLGDAYKQVQDKVNEILKGSSKKSDSKSSSSTKSKSSDSSEYEVKDGGNHYKYKAKKTSNSVKHSAFDDSAVIGALCVSRILES